MPDLHESDNPRTDSLPPLIEKIDPASAESEFERLMHQLLRRDAERHGYFYQPRFEDSGRRIHGLVSSGLPGYEGPVAFQHTWLSDDVDQGRDRVRIVEAFSRAAASSRIRDWILVTPRDLTPTESGWLKGLPARPGLRVHSWGRARVEALLRLSPALLARYHPRAAQSALPSYDGFDFRDFAAQYRRKIARRYRRLRTIDLPAETFREIDLGDIVVPPRLHSLDERKTLTLRELLLHRRSTVVLAEPGMGKSTLIAFLALLHAGAARLADFAPPPAVVPLVVPLKDFVEAEHEEHGLSLLHYFESRTWRDLKLVEAHWAFFEATLEMGEAVVLFDGLDEVGGTAARRRICSFIRAFRTDYPECPIWVTSTAQAHAGNARLPRDLFAHVQLDDFDEEQIHELIRRWYAVQLPDTEGERLEREESMRLAVHANPSAGHLAGSPLLLTLLASIHQSLGRLPEKRGELYEECVDRLLEIRDRPRARSELALPPTTTTPVLDAATRKDYLAHLALGVLSLDRRPDERPPEPDGEPDSGPDAGSLTSDGEEDLAVPGQFSRREALDLLADRRLRHRPELTLDGARGEMEEYLHDLCGRPGLLVDLGNGQLSFLHRAFQEYLAAWACTTAGERDDPEFFCRHLGDPEWEEILLLRMWVVSRTTKEDGTESFDTIVDALLQQLRSEPLEAGWLTMARAVRDHLDFTARDEERILRRAIQHWIDAGRFSGTWFSLLEEICAAGGRPRRTLESLLRKALARRTPAAAVACLHLMEKLFGLPEDAAEKLCSRDDLPAPCPDLVLFSRQPAVGDLLGSWAWGDWYRAIAALDGPETYQLSLAWSAGGRAPIAPPPDALAAMLALQWRKIVEELRSRRTFERRHPHDGSAGLYAHSGVVRVEGQFRSVELPLAAIRSCGGAEGKEGTPTAPLVDLEPAEILCPLLTEERLRTLDRGRDPELALALWARSFLTGELRRSGCVPRDDGSSEKLATALGRYFGQEFGRDVSRYMAQSFSFEGSEELLRDFGRYFSRDYGRDFGRDFVRDSAHRSVRNVLRGFLCSFGRYFARYYIRDLGQEVAREFAHDYLRYFVSYFGRDFVRDYVRDLGLELRSTDWEEEIETGLRDGLRLLKGLFGTGFWSLVSLESTWQSDLRVRTETLAVRLSNPLALPIAVGDIWTAATVNHLFTLCRSLAVEDPDGHVPPGTVEAWLRSHPIEVYAVGLSWEERARKLVADGRRLEGAGGALLLAHGAYAALMTGLPCEGAAWATLVEQRDRDDPGVEISRLLGEICRFRDTAANIRLLSELADTVPAELRPLIEGIA